MKTETVVWLAVCLIGAALLLANGIIRDAGRGFEKVVPMRFVNVGTAEDPNWINYDSPEAVDHEVADQPFANIPAADRISWNKYEKASLTELNEAARANPNQTEYRTSVTRTLGIWVAAFFTLSIFSFLYRDNPLYKIAESVVVGVSAAYWMVVGFWDTIVPNLVGKLFPAMIKSWSLPGLTVDADASWTTQADLLYIIPLFLGVLLLMRLSPKGGWISRWPMAFIIGVFCGLRLCTFIHADFLSQIRNTIVSLYATDAAGAFDFWQSLRGVILVVGVLACLVYFFFSIEHRGVVGGTARLGIWFLMITFGAAFGYTVMGRIALLAIRLEFLFDDWLWMIDPTGHRAVAGTVGMLWYQLPMIAGVG